MGVLFEKFTEMSRAVSREERTEETEGESMKGEIVRKQWVRKIRGRSKRISER